MLLTGNAVAGMIDCGRVDRRGSSSTFCTRRCGRCSAAMVGSTSAGRHDRGDARMAPVLGRDGAAMRPTAHLIALGLRPGARRTCRSVHRGMTQAQAISV